MTQRSTAVVKWFNNKAGYGFLTHVVDDQTSQDIFVHHTEIQVGKDQYKYLVQGEYVEFTLSSAVGQHKCLATAVRGVNGGRLMCETRSDTRSERPPREFINSSRGGSSRGRMSRTEPISSQPPTLPADAQGEWMVVKRTHSHTSPSQRGRGGGRRPVAELSH